MYAALTENVQAVAVGPGLGQESDTDRWVCDLMSSQDKPLVLDADLRRKQVRNMLLLAAVFFVLFYTFPAGMVLYWTTNNLISVSKSLWKQRSNAADSGRDE